jgi:hypothetical protein
LNDCDSCREAGEAGSLGPHSQEESVLVTPAARETFATHPPFIPERNGVPPRMQHPGGQTRLAQQLRTAWRLAALAVSALASPETDTIPAVATKAIKASRKSFG